MASWIGSLFQSEQHLVIHCSACDWRMRCTPAEACEIFGERTSFEQAWRMVKACPRCGATGIGGDHKIDVRACMGDYYAVMHYRRALSDAARRPEAPPHDLESKAQVWSRRRPREPGSFEIRLTPAMVGRPVDSPRYTFRGSSFRAETLHP